MQCAFWWTIRSNLNAFISAGTSLWSAQVERIDWMRVCRVNGMFENTCETSVQWTCDAATDQPNVNELVKERCWRCVLSGCDWGQLWPHGVAVSTLDSESSDPSSSLGGASCYVTMWTSSTSLMHMSCFVDFALPLVCFRKKIRSIGLALPFEFMSCFWSICMKKGRKRLFVGQTSKV